MLGVELVDALLVHQPTEDAGALGLADALGVGPVVAIPKVA